MIDGQGLKLIEPLRELFKDEVRQLGRQLGVHEDLVMRYVTIISKNFNQCFSLPIPCSNKNAKICG